MHKARSNKCCFSVMVMYHLIAKELHIVPTPTLAHAITIAHQLLFVNTYYFVYKNSGKEALFNFLSISELTINECGISKIP
jgi:hypothetical protein